MDTSVNNEMKVAPKLAPFDYEINWIEARMKKSGGADSKENIEFVKALKLIKSVSPCI